MFPVTLQGHAEPCGILLQPYSLQLDSDSPSLSTVHRTQMPTSTFSSYPTTLPFLLYLVLCSCNQMNLMMGRKPPLRMASG